MKDCKYIYKGVKYDDINQIIEIIKTENFGNPFDNQELGTIRQVDARKQKEIQYSLKAVNILQSDRAKQVFAKGKKNNWDLKKILTELQIPKEQKQIILDKYKGKISEQEFIKSIFPDSKTEQIFYHFTTKEAKEKILKEGFKINKPKENDLSFSKDEQWKDWYRSEEIPVILNIKNPAKASNRYYLDEKKQTDNTIDGAINLKTSSTHYATIVYNPDQVHILTEKEQAKIYNEDNLREEIITSLLADNSFTVEINTAKEKLGGTFTEGVPTQHYSNLTVPGGTNYTENEIVTPDITPSIIGHAEFSTAQGIGWFRSDEKKEVPSEKVIQSVIDQMGGTREMAIDLIQEGNDDSTKTRRILEIQSDLFQKGRNKKDLIFNPEIRYDIDNDTSVYFKNNKYFYIDRYEEGEYEISYEKASEITRNFTVSKTENKDYKNRNKENQFLQLLNKKNNWVTFFVKSIIQDSAKKGYEKVLFPKGDTAAKIEGHQTLEEFKKEKETRIKELEKKDSKYYDNEYDIAEMSLPEEVTRKDYIQSNLKRQQKEIKTLKQELADVESGKTQLSSIAKFYEDTVTNILKKNGYNPVEITDEHGNKWNEIEITDEAVDDILLSPRSINNQNNNLSKYELFPGVFANKEQKEAINGLESFLTEKTSTKLTEEDEIKLQIWAEENQPDQAEYDRVLDDLKRKNQDDKSQAISLIGRGGTGKTTIIKKVVENISGRKLYIAPTHKAKSILSKSVGKKAYTLASSLAIKLNEATGEFSPDPSLRRFPERLPIKQADIIIIDEGSMVNDKLFEEVLSFKKSDAKVIFMGDNVQLPPVGQETDSKMFDLKNFKLVERMRQGENSPIVPLTDIVARNVESNKPINRVIKDRESNFDGSKNEGVLFLNNEDTIINEFVKDFEKYPKNTKIITFNNENNKSSQSVGSLNKIIRGRIAPNHMDEVVEGDQLMAYSSTLRNGVATDENLDVQNSSDYTVKNVQNVAEHTITVSAKSKKLGSRNDKITFEAQKADLVDNSSGIILSEHFILTSEGKNALSAFKDKYSKRKDYQMLYKVDEKIPRFEFAYAITSHKSQGSTYRNVYIMEDNILAGSLRSAKNKNQSLYVAVSRASHKVVIHSSQNPNNEIPKTIRTKKTASKLDNANLLYDGEVEGKDVYEKLGNKTEIGNVKIVGNIFDNKTNKDVITAFRVDKKLGLLESFRKYNAIGNPINWQGFKPRFKGDNATIAFMDWFLGKDYTNLEQEYRQEILNSLENLKGKTIEYYKELDRPSHATALDYLIKNQKTTGKISRIEESKLEPVSENYGVYKSEKNFGKKKTKEFIELLKPQAEKQTFKENKGKNANMMFHYGLRWGRRKGNPSLGVPAMKSPISNNPADGGSYYGYDLYDQKGNPLPPVSDLQPIIDDIQDRTDIDMTNYDSVIANIYLEGEYIYPHRDTTESKSAEKYPVVVYTLGNDAALGIWDNNKGKMTFANTYDSRYAPGSLKNTNPTNEVKTKNGSIYTFGLYGNGRFNLVHTTPSVTSKPDKYPPITLPNGKTVTNYTITLTFRRAQNLEETTPKTPKPLPVGEQYEKWLYGEIESENETMKNKRDWIIEQVMNAESQLNKMIKEGKPLTGNGEHIEVLKKFIKDNSPLFTDNAKLDDLYSQRVSQQDIDNLDFDCS